MALGFLRSLPKMWIKETERKKSSLKMLFSLLSLAQLGLWNTKYIQTAFRTIAMKRLLMSSSLATDDSVKTLKNKFNLWKHQKVLLRETFINFSKFKHHIFLPRMKLMDENHVSVSSSGSFPQRESVELRALNMSVRRNQWAYKLTQQCITNSTNTTNLV